MDGTFKESHPERRDTGIVETSFRSLFGFNLYRFDILSVSILSDKSPTNFQGTSKS